MALEPCDWVLEVSVPDQDVEVKAAGDDELVVHGDCDSFDSFVVAVELLAEMKAIFPHLV